MDHDDWHSSRARRRWFHILHKPSPDNPAARRVNYLLAFLILSNALSLSVETLVGLDRHVVEGLRWFERFSTAVYIVEYLARLWVCVEQSHLSNPVVGRLRYALQPLALLDLIVIVTAWFPIDLRFLRVARMVRLLKVLRLNNLEHSLAKVEDGLRRRSGLILLSVALMLVCIYASAALVYQLEHELQPTVFSSIPGTMWWAVSTLTTIGYGDMIPKTPPGKFFTSLITVFGIGIFALPSSIITAVIIEASLLDRDKLVCRHCGRLANGHESPPEP